MTNKSLMDIFDEVVSQKDDAPPPEATKALNDLAYFNETIFDRKNAPFHNDICKLLDNCAFNSKNAAQHKQVILMPRGSGKCVRGSNTLITMLDGTRKYARQLCVNDKIIGVTKDYKFVADEILAIKHVSVKNGIRLILESGQTIDISKNHRFPTFEDLKKASDIKIGDWLCIPKIIKSAVTNEPTDAEILIIAHWLAEGALDRFMITSSNNNVVKELEQSADELCLVHKTYDYSNCKVIAINPMSWLTKKGARIKENTIRHKVVKRIPEVIFASSECKKALFLNRFYNGDGSIEKSEITVTQAEKNVLLLRDIQTLLLHFGIHSHINSAQKHYTINGNRSRNFDVFILSIREQSSRKLFLDKIGNFGRKVPANYIKSTSWEKMLPPAWRKLLPQCNFWYKKQGIRIDNKYRTTEQKVQKVYELFPSEGMKSLLQQDVRWERVKRIEALKSFRAIDIQTKTGLFLANDIVSHNSSILSVSYPLQQIAKNRDIRILLVSNTVGLVKEWMRQIETVMMENKLYKEWYGNMVPAAKTQTWSDTEKIVSGRSPKATHLTMFAVGSGGALLGRRADLLIADDILSDDNTATEYQRQAIEQWFFLTLLPCVEPNGSIICLGCVAEGTPIMMADGSWKNVSQLLQNDNICTYNENTNSVEHHVVETLYPQGKQEVLEIKTIQRTIKVTKNHPFLILESISKKLGKQSPIYKWQLTWKRADQLSNKDLLVTVNNDPLAEISDLPDPLVTNPLIAWFFGYFIGDGWLVKNSERKEVTGLCIAKSVGRKEKCNRKAIEALKYLGADRITLLPVGSYRVDNRAIAKWMQKLGFFGNAHTKRIPSWVYKLPANIKTEFIKGFVDADGTNYRKKDTKNIIHGGFYWSVEICNKPLLDDFVLLAHSCGIRASANYSRKRLIQAPNSKVPMWFLSYHGSFTFPTETCVQQGKYRVHNIDALGKGVILDQIKSITIAEPIEVYDISVEGVHNFIANGFVAHNTRFHGLDIYNTLKNKNWPYYSIGVKDKDGHSIWPERYTDEQIKAIEIDEGSIYFNLTYMNDTSALEGNILKREWLHFYDEKDLPDDLEIFQAFDPCITATKGTDNCVLATVGLNRQNNTVYILDIIVENIALLNQLALLEAQAKIYRPLSLGIESNAAQALIPQIMEQKILVPIKPIKTTVNKASRFISLSALFQSRRVLLKGIRDINGILQPSAAMKPFVNEWVSFPKGKDDVLDAVDMAVGLAAMFGPAPVFGSGYYTKATGEGGHREINMFHKNF